MSSLEKDRDLIDKYLQDRLNDNERDDFLSLMEADIALKNEVLKEKKIIAALKASDKAQLKKSLESVSADVVASTPNAFNPLWLAAASVVLLVSVTYFIYFSGPSSEFLFDQYYEPYPALGIQRGSASTTPEALSLYDDGKYAAALSAFNKTDFSDKPVYYLFVGNSQMQLNRIDKAVESFNTLATNTSDPILQQHAKWYLTMAYLKDDQQDKAISILDALVKENSIYAKNASSLLKELK